MVGVAEQTPSGSRAPGSARRPHSPPCGATIRPLRRDRLSGPVHETCRSHDVTGSRHPQVRGTPAEVDRTRMLSQAYERRHPGPTTPDQPLDRVPGDVGGRPNHRGQRADVPTPAATVPPAGTSRPTGPSGRPPARQPPAVHPSCGASRRAPCDPAGSEHACLLPWGVWVRTDLGPSRDPSAARPPRPTVARSRPGPAG